MNEPPFIMRKPCAYCGSERGSIRTKSGQDCVFCECGRHQYNAPKTETGRDIRSVTTVHADIKPKQRMRILLRANGRCEVCGKSGTEATIHVGHIVSVKVGLAAGLTEEVLNDDENLMSMCDECNLGLGSEPMPIRFLIRVLMERITFNRKSIP